MKTYNIFFKIIFSGIWAQLLMVISSVLFARLYSPDDFGVLAYVSGFASIIAIVSGLRFDYIAFSKKEEEKHMFNVLTLFLMFVVHITLIFFVIISNFFSDLFSGRSYWLVFFSFSSSIFYLSTQLLVSIGNYKYFSRVRILQALLQLIFGFLFFYFNWNNGLVIAYSLSQLLIGLIVYNSYFKKISNLKINNLKECFLADYKHASYNTIIVLIQYATPFAPILFGQYLFNSKEVGAFYLISSAVASPMSILRRSLLNLFNGEVTSIQKAKDLITNFKKKNLVFLSLIFSFVFCVLFLFFYSEDVVLLFFGKQWLRYSYYVIPIFVFFFLDMIFQPFTTLLPLWGKQKFSMFFECLRFLLVFLVVPLVAYLMSFSYFSFFNFYFFATTLVYVLVIFKVYRSIYPTSNTAV
ncbi:lipopolysaccharide biosynthesis protein [Chryseobacterium scophthalmum]|uniref:lipopolysaccharide biosynthesis protein n=1 Tax=Chryseobacterium scophthalmum TaxID=59733 RepID=UPI0011807607|nr:oligosaccharide flippase family protein [Chryseobacterium scophthalmum]